MKKIIILIFVLLLSLNACSVENPEGVIDELTPPRNILPELNELTVKQPKQTKSAAASENISDQKKTVVEEQQGEAQAEDQKVKLENLSMEYDQAIIKTNYGDIVVGFYAAESPLTVNNFMNLAKQGFYNGTKFHRVIDDFMIQGGDPLSKDDNWSDDGTGGPNYFFQDEINSHKLLKGSLAMANSGPNTNGSQFFIVTKDSTPWLDGMHTNFGYVIKGLDVVEKIEAVQVNEKSHPLEDIVIESIELLKSTE